MRRCELIVFSLVWIAGLAPEIARAQAGAAITIEQITESWQQRQQAVGSWAFEWTTERTEVQGSYLRPDPQGEDKENPKGLTLPSETTTFTCKGLFWVEGRLWRYEIEELMRLPSPKLGIDRTICVSNNSHAKGLYGRRELLPYPQGSVGPPSNGPADMQNPLLFPILLTYRALDSKMGRFKATGLKEFRIVSADVEIDNRHCVAILRRDRKSGPAEVQETLYLDSERGFLPMRWGLKLNDVPFQQVDVLEHVCVAGFWTPIRWNVMESMDGRIERSLSVTTTRHDLNLSLDPASFELEFPYGTLVNDYRRKGRVFIGLKNGQERDITPEEMQARPGYERLLATPSGMALRQGPERSTAWIWTAGIGALVASGGLWLRWYTNRRAVSP